VRPHESTDFDQTLHSPHIYAKHQITGGKIAAETPAYIAKIYRDIDIHIDYRNSTKIRHISISGLLDVIS